MTELKPCPFCGGKKLSILFYGQQDYAVTCVKCETNGPMIKTETAAIAAWNKRVEKQEWEERFNRSLQIVIDKKWVELVEVPKEQYELFETMEVSE